MTCACGDRIPIAKKWDSPIYGGVSRMATYPVLTILNPFCRLADGLNEGRERSASRCLQCGGTRAGQDMDVPAGVVGTRSNTASTILR